MAAIPGDLPGEYVCRTHDFRMRAIRDGMKGTSEVPQGDGYITECPNCRDALVKAKEYIDREAE